MRMHAKFDMAELQSSLARFSKRHGDGCRQAVIRWSIAVCNEMAFRTQIYGKRGVKKKQTLAIWRDVWNVIYKIDRIPRNTRSDKYLKTPDEVLQWMDDNRGRGRRTRKLAERDRKAATITTIRKAIRAKLARIGMAKGGWIGAGLEIAEAQRGGKAIRVGAGMAFAKKHARFGSAQKPKRTKPTAKMSNRVRHVASNYVLKKSASKKAIQEGLRKTVKYYQYAVRAMERKSR